MYFYVKNDKYPDLLGVANDDYFKLRQNIKHKQIAFLTTQQIDRLRYHCIQKLEKQKPLLYWNSSGKQGFLVDLIGHRESFDLTVKGINNQRSRMFLHIPENVLYFTYLNCNINEQHIMIVYSDLDRNDYYKTSDNIIDFDLFESYLSINALHYGFTYNLHTTEISTKWLIDEYFTLQPLILEPLKEGKITPIKWLKPSEQNQETVQAILNEYRLERI